MKYYMVNTNKKLDPQGNDEKSMLQEQIVSLYFDGQKQHINKINDGDIVFLYSNKTGVIAGGQVWGQTQKRNYKGLVKLKNEEYFKNFKTFFKPSEPVTIKQMTSLFGKKPAVIKAFILLSDAKGQILFDTIATKVRHLRVA